MILVTKPEDVADALELEPVAGSMLVLFLPSTVVLLELELEPDAEAVEEATTPIVTPSHSVPVTDAFSVSLPLVVVDTLAVILALARCPNGLPPETEAVGTTSSVPVLLERVEVGPKMGVAVTVMKDVCTVVTTITSTSHAGWLPGLPKPAPAPEPEPDPLLPVLPLPLPLPLPEPDPELDPAVPPVSFGSKVTVLVIVP